MIFFELNVKRCIYDIKQFDRISFIFVEATRIIGIIIKKNTTTIA